jgi:hypothetical protein
MGQIGHNALDEWERDRRCITIITTIADTMVSRRRSSMDRHGRGHVLVLDASQGANYPLDATGRDAMLLTTPAPTRSC